MAKSSSAVKVKSNGSASNGEVVQAPVKVANRLDQIGESLSPFVSNEINTFTRLALMRIFSGELPALDIDKECRYPRELGMSDYVEAWSRNGVATRVVAVYPEEAWAMEPEIYETEELSDVTEFEGEWEEMNERLNILTNLQTADEVSGIGSFGIVLLGFSDGRDPKEPVPGIRADGTGDARFKSNQLIYLRPLSQQFVRILEYETNTANPRYGQPLMYSIGLVSPQAMASTSSTDPPPPEATMQAWTKVHWSRVLHLAKDRKNSDIFGKPQQQDVFNECLNIRKILGASGQGYWSGGFPGLSIETHPQLENLEIDKKQTRKDALNYISGMQRLLLLEGLTAKSLAVQVADPKPHYDTQLGHICATKAVPLRVFKGTEEAKLASGQDMRTWNKRLAKYQNSHVSPYVLRQFFNRMFLVGALSRPKKLFLKWPDLNAPTENDRSNTAAKITDSLVKYITGNVFMIMPPKEYLTLVLGYSLPQVEAILNSAGVKKMMASLDKLVKLATTPPAPPANAAIKKGKKPAADSGAGKA